MADRKCTCFQYTWVLRVHVHVTYFLHTRNFVSGYDILSAATKKRMVWEARFLSSDDIQENRASGFSFISRSKLHSHFSAVKYGFQLYRCLLTFSRDNIYFSWTLFLYCVNTFWDKCYIFCFVFPSIFDNVILILGEELFLLLIILLFFPKPMALYCLFSIMHHSVHVVKTISRISIITSWGLGL